MVSSLAHLFAVLIAAAGGVTSRQMLPARLPENLDQGWKIGFIAQSMSEAESWRRQQAGKAERKEGREGQSGVAKAIASHQDIRARGQRIPRPTWARPFALVGQLC